MYKRAVYYRAKKTYPKPKYSSLMKVINSTQTLTSGQATQIVSYDLVANSTTDSGSPSPTIIKFARVKISGTVSTNVPVSDIGQLYVVRLYIAFCPQEYTYDSFSKISAHPEYIIAVKDLPMNPEQRSTFTLSSKLKRNLNSGDKIQYIITINKESSLTGSVSLWFEYQYWVRNN